MQKASVRKEQGLFLVEGRKLVEEALLGHHRLREVICLAELFPVFADRLSVPVYEVSAAMLERLSQVEQSQGVLGLVEAVPWPEPKSWERVVVAVDLQDPGNLGTLMRTAWAAGAQALFCVDGVDPHHPKVVRASAGAVFHLPCYRFRGWDGLQALPAIGLVPRGGVDLYEMDWPERWALWVGNEAHGLSLQQLEQLSHRCTIPMQPGCESLNAATSAAIVLFEWRRRHLAGSAIRS